MRPICFDRWDVRCISVSLNKTPMSSSVTPACSSGAVIFIGASTGGTEAIKVVLQGLSIATPPILVVQHMPEAFTAAFARRLDSMCPMRVKEAQDGEHLAQGCAYVSPGHSHLTIARTANGYQSRLLKDGPVNRHRPSIDVLFQSAAKQVGAAALGVLLTGMGKDGACGLLEMRRRGGWTIAQDEASSVVYGMPREAATIGAVMEVLPLSQIAVHVSRKLGAVHS